MMTGRITGRLLAGLGALVGLVMVGCDWVPNTPTPASQAKVDKVAVDTSDTQEPEAVSAMLEAKANYRQALNVTRTYYYNTGNYDKQKWAERELKNLDEAMSWSYEGVPAAAQPPAQAVDDVSEAALAEQVVAARRGWKDTLDTLLALYKKRSLEFKAKLIANVLERFRTEKSYDYFLVAEIPPATLSPSEVIPAAETLFAKAYKLYKDGRPLPLLTSYPKEREALGLFRQVVNEHPNSTRIAQAAFYIAEIYKEYFNENIRATQWYERAWQWDPKIQLPARSQCAYIYDLRLAQYAKAVPLYRDALKYESYDPDRVRFCSQRIRDLTGK